MEILEMVNGTDFEENGIHYPKKRNYFKRQMLEVFKRAERILSFIHHPQFIIIYNIAHQSSYTFKLFNFLLKVVRISISLFGLSSFGIFYFLILSIFFITPFRQLIKLISRNIFYFFRLISLFLFTHCLFNNFCILRMQPYIYRLGWYRLNIGNP